MRAPPPNWTSGDGTAGSQWGQPRALLPSAGTCSFCVPGQQLWEGYHFCLREGSRTFQGHSFDGWEQENRFLGEGRKTGSHTRASTVTRGWFPEHTLIAQWPAVRFLPYRAAHRCLAWVLFKVVSKVRDKDIGALCLQAPPKLFASGG